MGTLVDTSVLIRLDRAGAQELPGLGQETGIAAITASELLHGVHRADLVHRGRRSAFVESVLRAFPVLPFDLATARVHARLWADLATAGRTIGAHDLLIAATAVTLGWSVMTWNGAEFRQVPGLEVREPG